MADGDPAGTPPAGQGPTATDPPVGQGAPPATPPADPPVADPPSDDGLTAEQLAAALKDTRAEAAKYRRSLRDVQAELEKARTDQAAATGDTEAKLVAANAKTAELEAKLGTLLLRQSVDTAAKAAGAVDNDLVWAVLRDRLKPDSDEAAITAAITAFRVEKPLLFPPPSGPPAGAPATPGGQPAGETDDARRARIRGTGGGFYDDISARGGGVVAPVRDR